MPWNLRCSIAMIWCVAIICPAEDFPKPYSPAGVERENVFEFTEKPKVKNLGNDRYEIAFAVKGNCDATVSLIDMNGKVVRHLASGVLGANAPLPFQKNALKQTIYWNGKDDLEGYVKETETLKVRVQLGLKPEFDKLLADYGPHNLPNVVGGIAIGEEGAWVFAMQATNHGHMIVRRFDHDGNYVAQLTPPPANLPESKLSGLSYVEYEAGVRAVQGPDIAQMSSDGFVLPILNWKWTASFQPAVIGKRVYFANPGGAFKPGSPSLLHFLHTDGSTDALGIKGAPFVEKGSHLYARFAVSPDGKRLYLSGLCGHMGNRGNNDPYVLVREVEGSVPARVFAGNRNKPGNDNESLNNPQGLDCDAQERVCVADYANNRLQLFSREGKWLKSIAVEGPHLIRLHRKTGSFYVTHQARIQGQTIGRLTKFKSFDEPKEVWHLDYTGDEPTPTVLAVDEWTAKPRLWTAGGKEHIGPAVLYKEGPSIRIFEDDGSAPRKIADFGEIARKQAGDGPWLGRWIDGSVGGKVECDAVRETAYHREGGSLNRHIFDLKSGRLLGDLFMSTVVDDVAFDKRGYMHWHWNGWQGEGAGGVLQGVSRVDPGRSVQRDANTRLYPEVPYDYGVEKEKSDWKGILPVKDQGGPCSFQNGIGVNMMGDVAENCMVWFVPKTGEGGFGDMLNQYRKDYGTGVRGSNGGGQIDAFNSWTRAMQDAEKKGEATYWIKRAPGVQAMGATVWTWDRNGELRKEGAALCGSLINGVHLDEEGCLYFVASATKTFGAQRFLFDRGGVFGSPEDKSQRNPFTGSLVKTRKGELFRLLAADAAVPLEKVPQRPPDLNEGGSPILSEGQRWTEGAEWIYAGASPIVPGGCACPTSRFHLDWYKRSYVPETYRHSIGVVDTSGNLILHLGKYGNYDSGFGAKSRIPVGGDHIAMFMPRTISGTDHYLAFMDWGERLVVLHLNYHAEETVSLK